MKTGDIVRDGQGRAYQIGQLLRRDLWSKTYAAREDSGGAELAIKLALTRADLPDGMSHLVPVCRDALLEEAAMRTDPRASVLAPLVSRITTAKSVPALLIARSNDTLERKLSSGITLKEALQLCVKVADALLVLEDFLPLHGNLSPASIAISERGELVLPCPLVPKARTHLAELRAASGIHDPYLPPEHQPGAAGGAPSPVMDSYAIAAMLYWGVLASGEGASRPPDVPLDGLDKSMLVALKDRVHSRLKEEKANPRFHTRLSDRTAALLNRALSKQTSPSPPYRFQDLTEFQRRLRQLLALVHPRVKDVGKILLDRPPGSDTYTTDEDVNFSCTIGCTAGVESHEEIGCGLAIFDRDTGSRIRNLQSIYTASNHPSGRLRFGFTLSNVPPGSYLVRVAFTIHDSGDDPMLAEGRFECRPAPGYVPPPADPKSRRPIPMQRPEDEPVTQTKTAPRPIPASEAQAHAPAPAPAPAPEPSVTQPGVAAASVGAGVAGVNVGGQPATVHHLNVAPRAEELPPLRPPPRRPEPAPASEPDAYESMPTSPRVSVKPPRTRPIHTQMSPPPAEDDPYDFPDPGIDPDSDGGHGVWESELPAPEYDDGLYEDDGDEDDWTDDQLPSGPLGDAMGRLIDLVRGDAYVMFIGSAAVVIMLLIGLLWALR